MTTTQCTCTGCAVQQGTHQPAEALHQIAEPDAQHLQELAAYRFTVENLRERVAELEAEPFMWAIQEPGGSAYMDENCVSTSRGIVEAEVDGLNLGLGADDEPYKVVPVYLAATQPAAQGMEADLADEQIDEAFNQMPDGAAGFLKSWGYRQFARAVLAAQAKQGGA